MRWPTGTDVTAIRQREKNYSRFYLGVQRGKERTSGCGVHGGAGIIYVGCHYLLGNLDAYDAAEHVITFGTVGILAGTDIRPGMTLAVGTLADPFLYGSARIRYVDAATDQIYLEPNNLSAEGYLIAGDYIWVDGVYRLYRILPRIDNGVVYEDGNPDSAAPGWGLEEGIAFDARYLDRPVALMGSPRFAWTNEAINFYGWRSHGRGGRVINTYLWDFDGGVAGGAGVAAAGTPAAPVTATWNAAGEYIASLTVTDNSGNAANDFYGVPFEDHVAVRPVLVYDRPGGSNPPYSNFQVKSLRGSYGSGWSASIEVFGTANKSEFPDNALIIIFCEDWYGGTRGSRGGWYGQEGILFCGYILADSVQVDSEKSIVSFEARTIEQWMKDIDVWPCNCESTAGAPTAWHEFQAMTCEDVLWYLAEFHSTLKHVTDCFFASDVNAQKALGFLDLTESSLYDQMSDQIGSCFFGRVSASRHGSIHLFKHKNMMDLVERTTWGPPIWIFAKQDWRDELEVGDERMRDSVAQVDFIGFIYDTDGNPQEVYSLAPARQTNFGMIEKVTGVLLTGNTIAAAQGENNVLSGLYRAWKNIRFPHIRVAAFNNRFLEPATLDYFGVTLAASDTVRGYTWSGKEFLCTEVSYEIDVGKGYIIADVTGEASTWGPEGVAGPYPNVPPDDDPPDEPPEYWPPGLPASDPPPWSGLAACIWDVGVATHTGFYTTNDITPAPPTWTARNNGLAGAWLVMHDVDMQTDIATGTTLICAVTDGGVARSTNCASNWEQLTLPDPANDAGDGPAPTVDDLSFLSVRVDPTDINRVFVLARWLCTAPCVGRAWIYHTDDALAASPTWTSHQLYRPAGGFSYQWYAQYGPGQIDISGDGTVWFLAHVSLQNLPGVDCGFSPQAFKSVTHGDSWVYYTPTSYAINQGNKIYLPGIQAGPYDGDYAYVFGGLIGTVVADYCRVTDDGGLTWYDAETGLPAQNHNTLRIDPRDASFLFITADVVADLYNSTDYGANWANYLAGWLALLTDMVFLTSDTDTVIFIDAGPPSVIYYSNDKCLTYANRTGALAGLTHTSIVLPNKEW